MAAESGIHPLVIIGSGPAGYTAALYAARANLSPVMYAGDQPGGQLMITGEVENFPGYPEGVSGPQMMEDLRKQCERFGTALHYERIEQAHLAESPKRLYTADGKEVLAHAVIIATGASAKWLGLPSEQRLMGGGVSACAVCDGFFYKNEVVVIVGGGDSACEEAGYLSKMCAHVNMLVRRGEMRASKIMQERVLSNPKITVHWHTEPLEVLGDRLVEGVRVADTRTGEQRTIEAKGFFVAIGHQPNTQIFEGQLEMDEAGYLITQGKSTRTNLPGVFACGDVQDNTYRQAVTAAGTGCMAALDAERWLVAQGLH
jgi:thioredoxin reductase (NADPH)